MKDVSIIVLSWNARDMVEQCLEALGLHATKYSMETVVVDNASTDGAWDMVREKYPHARLIRNRENLGFAKGNNVGIRATESKYLCLLNSDIVILPGCLDRVIDYMEAHPHVGLLSPKLLNPDRSIRWNCRNAPSLWIDFCEAFGLARLSGRFRFFSGRHLRHFDHNSELEVDAVAGSFWVVRRSSLAKVGLLDESFFFYGEDVDWCKRFREAGWKIVFYPGGEAFHYHKGSSSSDPIRYYIQLQRANLTYWRKHNGWQGQASAWGIALFHQLNRIIVNAILCFSSSNRAAAASKLQRSVACLCWLLSGQYRGGASAQATKASSAEPSRSARSDIPGAHEPI